MVTREELKAQWSHVKGRLREHWSQLTDDDLQLVEASADQLIGLIQQKTGVARNEVEEFLTDLLSEGQSAAGRVSQAAAEYAQQVSQSAGEQYEGAADAAAEFSQKVAHTVRNRPTESMLIAFGLGIAAGALLFLGRRR